MNAELLLREFDRLSEAPDAVSRCRQAILDLAVQGQLHGEDAREWPRCTVAEVLDSLQTGPFGSSLHQTDYESGGTPVINPASIQDGRIIPIPKMAVGPATLDRLASFKVSSSDVVMARRGEMGRCAVVTPREDGWLCGTGCLVLHPAQAIFPDYLAMFIGAPRTRQYLNSASVGATLQNLNQRILLGLEIVVPPFEEQRRIVSRVDELMTVCDELETAQEQRERRRKQLLAASLVRLTAPGSVAQKDVNFFLSHSSRIVTRPGHLANVRQAIVDLAYTGRLVPSINSGENVRLGDVSTLQNGYAFKSEWYARDGVRLLRNANVGPGSIDWSDSVRLPNNRFHEFERFALTAGDIVVSLDRPFISTGTKVARLRPDDVPALLLQRVGRFLTDGSRLTDDYLLGWLRSPRFVDQVTPGRSNGVPHISSKAVESTHIYLPTLQEQAVIVARVDELMAVCDELERSLETLEAGRTRALEAVLHGVLEEAGAPLPELLEAAR